jgi:hypothetical protein
MLVIRKYQGKILQTNALKGMDFLSKIKTVLRYFNLNYGLKEMLITSFDSILGGLAGGLLFNKNENKKSKIKESVFQFNNIAIPTSIVAGLLRLTKDLKSIFPQIASIIVRIGAEMPIATTVSNKINNSIIDKIIQIEENLSQKIALST